jgi:hypothetical protein
MHEGLAQTLADGRPRYRRVRLPKTASGLACWYRRDADRIKTGTDVQMVKTDMGYLDDHTQIASIRSEYPRIDVLVCLVATTRSPL